MYTDYNEYNDYELLNYVAENIEEASDIVFEKYQPLVHGISNKMYKYANNCGFELNDLVQEANIALTSAINSYSDMKDVMFYTYARSCIEKRLISYLIAAKRQKHQILNESISYDSFDDPAYNLLKDENSDPLELLISGEQAEKLETNLRNKLTDLELQVFELMLVGFKYKEISDILNKDPKSIDNSFQRIRSKAKNILNR